MQIQTINIALPRQLVEQVDEVAQKEYKDRSQFVKEALGAYLRDKQEWQEIFTASEKAMKTMGIKGEEEVSTIVSEYRHGRTSN